MDDPKKIEVGQMTVKVNTYKVVQECVERGLAYGYKRAFKHTENPDEDMILEAQQQAVMNELCEYLNFGDER